MEDRVLRLNGVVEHDPAIEAWFAQHRGPLGLVAHECFQRMRSCGDEVMEILHDGCPVACFGDVPFAYVNVFTHHVNVGFFQGAKLADPAYLLQGTGRHMRHLKLRPVSEVDIDAVYKLIQTAYGSIKARVENNQS